MASFASRLLADDACEIQGDGEQTHDLVYVDDVVDAFVRAATRGSGLLCNVGTGVETSVNDLYRRVSAAVGVDRPARQAPARTDELQRMAVDPGRAAIHLGWQPWTDLSKGSTRLSAGGGRAP